MCLKKKHLSITIQSPTTDNAAKKSAVARAAQKDPIENQGYAIMCPPIQNPRPLPIIPKLLSFRLAILGQYLPFHALVPRKRRTKERVPSRQSYDALIKNYHPPTTKGALARHSLSPLSCFRPLFPAISFPRPPFLFPRRHFVFLFISPWSPRKLNKPRPLSLQSRKLGRRIKSYSLSPYSLA